MPHMTAKEVAQIRAKLNAKFPNVKFSVKKRDGSSGVDVFIMKSSMKFEGFLNQTEGQRPRTYYNLMPHHLEDAKKLATEEEKKFLREVRDIVLYGSDNKFFDESDSMSDYFHYAFNYSVNIGRHDKSYIIEEGQQDGK